MTVKISLVLALCLAVSLQVDPPKLPSSFQMAFDESFVHNGSTVRVNGQWYYDATKNRERTDRANGRYSHFCGSILPNVTTPCTHYAVGGKRWIAFPQKKQCCMCCDAAHGCGPLRQDWLKGAEFLGQERLIDTLYNKWNKDGHSFNHFWTTADENQIPRRLDEGGEHITDYLVHTYVNKTFDDSYFQLPSYCTDACPSTTVCGQLRSEETLISDYL